MPPRKKRTVTIHSSSDHENDQHDPELKSVEKRKPNSRKSADPQDQDGLPPKKPRGRPWKSAVVEGDGDLSAKKPKKKPRKRIDDEEVDDLPEQPTKKQKYKAHEPTDGGELQEIYLTQLPQDGSSSPPWRIRGPIWQKPKEQRPPPKPAVSYKPPQPPVAYKSPVSYKPPQGTGARSNPQLANARQPQRQQPQQNPSRSPVRNGVHNVTAALPTPEARQRNISNPAPFYSSPFTPPKELQNNSLRERSLSRTPSQKTNIKAPREATRNPQHREASTRILSPSLPMDAGADVELDPADFPSTLPSPSRQLADKRSVEDVFLDQAAITLPQTAKQIAPATILHDSPVTLNPNDISSSPPSPPKPASNNDEFDDDDLDDIDESLFQRLVSRPPNIDKPAKQAPPVVTNVAQQVDPELLDLPSDAFSESPGASSKSRRPAITQNVPILISSQENGVPLGPHRLTAPLNGLRQTTLFGASTSAIPVSQVNKRQNWPAANREEPPTHHKIDVEAMKTWIFPTNLGMIRDYQFSIVNSGLFHNLLVALPTGLGKTFIAATIMLNFLRWTTDAQVVFVAPTKPLVAQQIEACLGIAGIHRSQTTMLTGEVDPGTRAEEWKTKRVFFMTPQTMVNDLKTGYCDAKNIVLLVVDEAHRATGNYAYVEIVKFIRRFNQSFRVLALTATPGANIEAVQTVIDGLEISRVEIRMENSIDIQPFVHTRKVEKVQVKDNKDLLVVKDLFKNAVEPVMNKLNEQNAYWSKDPLNISQFGLQQAMARWQKSDAGRNAPGALKGMVIAIFMALSSLGRAIDMLKYHGIRPFYRILLDYKNEATTSSKKWQKEIVNHPQFDKLMKLLQQWTANPDYLGHPKLERLRQYVLNHFLDAGEGGGDALQTKVMVFAHWRDSAEDIVRVLKLSEPMIKPHVFVGQAASKNSAAMDQRRQEQVVKQFKEGEYNTLVATSIGEEGLDIGEVDLIVCYDQKASPIRMLQRMGRTGRKRQGKILLLQMEGKEENDALLARDTYEKMQDKISKGDEFRFHTDLARRIVPKEIVPEAVMKTIEIPIENSQPELPMPRRRGKAKRPLKKFQMPDGVITGFVTVGRMNGGSDGEGQPRTKRKAKKAPVVEEPELLVTAEEAFLNSVEEKQLQRFYQNIHDADDDREIAPPALSLHPERQRRKGRTRYISTHSRLTTAYVGMVNQMHLMDQTKDEELENRFRKHLHMSDVEAGSVGGVSEDEVDEKDYDDGVSISFEVTPNRTQRQVMDEVGEGASSSPPPTDPRMRFGSQAIDLGTQDTEGEDEIEDDQLDSELASFIADDRDPVETFSSSLPSMRFARYTKLFTSSQKENEDSDDDDLPELSELLQKKPGPARKPPGKTMVADSEDEDESDLAVRQRAKSRWVIDDSESE